MSVDHLNVKASLEEKKVDTNFLFLSLYLILFTFFIFLVSVSTIEQKKVEQGLHSVKAVFKGKGSQEDKNKGELTQGYIEGGNFDQKMQGIFQNLMPKGSFEGKGQGESLEIKMKAARIFSTTEGTQLTPQAIELLPRIVHLLKTPVNGKAVELAVLIGRKSTGVLRDENKFFGEKKATLAMGVLARTMVKMGIESEVFSVGFRDMPSDELVFQFRRAVVE